MYISLREAVTKKKMGVFSEVRPLSYQSYPKLVAKHIEEGNEAGFVVTGSSKAVRYSIKESDLPKFINWLIKYYQK